MEPNGIGKFTKSFGVSFVITNILSAILVIVKESNQMVFGWMVAASGHHWVSHGILDVILFLALGYGLSMFDKGRGIKIGVSGLILWMVGSVVISGLLIAGFFLFE